MVPPPSYTILHSCLVQGVPLPELSHSTGIYLFLFTKLSQENQKSVVEFRNLFSQEFLAHQVPTNDIIIRRSQDRKEGARTKCALHVVRTQIWYLLFFSPLLLNSITICNKNWFSALVDLSDFRNFF